MLPASFVLDPERVRRFEREARLLAALNHPHIAAIHSVDDTDGIHALVLELVEGPTLADRLAKGPLPLPDALAIARQVAEALEAAHEKGIIHRDLKPANVKVTPDGAVKVLDFGLAKAFVGDGGGPDLSQSPAVSVGGTCEGTILGTPTYMSPEQMRGQAVDKRTDIWAFGCVLYEMLTGEVAFRGGTISDTIAAILDREPTWGELPTRTPPKVRDLLRRCLQKDPTRRLRDIGDARMELEDAHVAPTDETVAAAEATAVAVPRLHFWQRPVPLVTGIVTVIVATGLTSWTLTRPAPPRVVRFTMTPSGANSPRH
jgi:serine/threonine protein kinase